MASYHKNQLNASAFAPLMFDDVYPAPVIGSRAPTTSDKAEYGTIWVDKTADTVYILTSIVANSATWKNLSGGAGTFVTVTATGAILGATSITATAGAITATAGAVVAGTTVTGGTGVTATTGNITCTAGDVEAATATKGFICGSGLKIIDGAGTPHASVTAPKGSLYLRTDGTTTNDRIYVNTDSSTTWTALTTAA